MATTWIQDHCPKCKKSNWINQGDVSDITGIDVEGCQCWDCGHKWLLGDFDEDADFDFADFHFEVGLKSPD